MFKKTILSLSLFSLLMIPSFALAQKATGISELKEGLGTFGENTGLGQKNDDDLKGKIANIVNITLGFLGIIAVLVIIYAGFQWITASGNSDQVSDAKGRIKNAAIGLVIVLASWVIISFAIKNLGSAIGGAGGGGTDVTGGSR